MAYVRLKVGRKRPSYNRRRYGRKRTYGRRRYGPNKRRRIGQYSVRKVVRRELNRSMGGHRFVQDQDITASDGLQVFRLGSNLSRGTSWASRLGDGIFVKGIKIVWAFHNQTQPVGIGTNPNQVPLNMAVRVALIRRKDDAGNVADRIFRRYKDDGPNSKNFYDFNELNSDAIKLYQPFNPDKWDVVAHKRIWLKGIALGAGQAGSACGTFYVPINKTWSYEIDTEGNTQVFPNYSLIWFPCQVDPVTSGDPFTPPLLASQIEATTFFDP